MLALVAFCLAGMGAYPGCEHGHGVHLHDNFSCPVPVVLSNLLHISRDIRSRGTFRGTRRYACFHAAHDGMVLIPSMDGVAFLSALSCTHQASAYVIRITVIPAAHILAEVSAHGCRIPHNWGCDAAGCFPDRVQPACKQAGFLDVAELCQRADGNRIAIVSYVSGIRNLLQVYKQFRIIRQQVLFQGSDQIRTSGNRLGFFI